MKAKQSYSSRDCWGYAGDGSRPKVPGTLLGRFAHLIPVFVVIAGLVFGGCGEALEPAPAPTPQKTPTTQTPTTPSNSKYKSITMSECGGQCLMNYGVANHFVDVGGVNACSPTQCFDKHRQEYTKFSKQKLFESWETSQTAYYHDDFVTTDTVINEKNAVTINGKEVMPCVREKDAKYAKDAIKVKMLADHPNLPAYTIDTIQRL
jgi:hypothetical protein